MMRPDRALERGVRNRAGGRCEYCHRPESVAEVRFVIDHVIAQKHRGRSTVENLALACEFCNLHKGSDIAGLDPVDGTLTRLFHPRKDLWQQHFRLDDSGVLAGLTPVGRTTLEVLAMNDPRQLALRLMLIAEGVMSVPG
jgi:hypothetical protein